MDFTTGILLPLILGGVGIFTILRLVRRIQARAYLKDAVVVITGATSGLGKECAKAFHAAGSQLVLCGRSGERLQDVLRELSAAADPLKNAHKHHVVVFDLSDINAVVSAAEEILSCVDHVDILINNAGISYRGTITETVIEVDRKVMETNYFGPVALTKALLPAMIKRRKGHIVTISSVQGKISIPFRSACKSRLPLRPLVVCVAFKDQIFLTCAVFTSLIRRFNPLELGRCTAHLKHRGNSGGLGKKLPVGCC
uniref:Dehydrogenase/reductase SDR family member 7B n=1 Tax=Pseudonaja textilis TaxID=8673 RepID=A0A670YBX9_PSETE